MAANGKIGPKRIIGKMELKDAIHAVDADYPGTIFYVGSESSFFFIGTAEEFDNDIDEINKMYHARFKTDRKRVLDNYISDLCEVAKEHKNYKTNVEDEVKLCEYIISKREQLVRNNLLVCKYHTALRDWCDIQDRIVKRCYKRDPHGEFYIPNSLVMIVPGYEQGKWSFYREYKRKTVQSDNKCGWYGDDKED